MHSNDIDPKALERVRGLLAVAEDAATPPEAAENYAAQAMRLIAKYGMDAAMLHHADRSADEVEVRTYTAANPFAYDQISLRSGITKALGCEAVNISTREDKGIKRLSVIGFGADLDRAEMLYASLIVQRTRALAATKGPRPGQKAAVYKRNFFLAFQVTVCERIKEAEALAKREATAAPGTSTDLVLADRGRQVAAVTKRHFPHLRSYGGSRSGSGINEGCTAGERADLGHDAAVDGRRRAIGA